MLEIVLSIQAWLYNVIKDHIPWGEFSMQVSGCCCADEMGEWYCRGRGSSCGEGGERGVVKAELEGWTVCWTNGTVLTYTQWNIV